MSLHVLLINIMHFPNTKKKNRNILGTNYKQPTFCFFLIKIKDRHSDFNELGKVYVFYVY